MAGLLRTPLVGRSAPLADLQVVVAEAVIGQGGAPVLYGEAGIGKTRLLEEVAGAAQESGCVVAWGRCTELEGVPPYWPWWQVLEALGASGPAAGQPRSRDQLLGVLIGAVAAVPRPVLLCIEDVHWADADSRWLLRGAIDATAGRPLAVLCTWRTAEGPDRLDDLPSRVHRVALDGLDPPQARELAQAVAGDG